MSAIEVDAILFTAGPRKGKHAVMVDDYFEFELFSLDGKPIIQWNGHALTAEESEWTAEDKQANDWLEANPFQIVAVAGDEVKRSVEQIASRYRGIKQVAIGENAPQGADPNPAEDAPKPRVSDASNDMTAERSPFDERHQRAFKLQACVANAGCELKVDLLHTKTVFVFVPEYPDYGTGIDMTAEIDSYLATGTPTAIDIVASAKKQAEDTDYYPAWNYILEHHSNGDSQE